MFLIIHSVYVTLADKALLYVGIIKMSGVATKLIGLELSCLIRFLPKRITAAVLNLFWGHFPLWKTQSIYFPPNHECYLNIQKHTAM